MEGNDKYLWACVDLKEDTPKEECLQIQGRINSIDGVLRTGFAPEGCFGYNVHRLLVLFNDKSSVEQELRSTPALVQMEITPAGPR